MSEQYIPRTEYLAHLKGEEDHETRIREGEQFRDTLIGKMWGVGIMAGAISGIVGIMVSHYWP